MATKNKKPKTKDTQTLARVKAAFVLKHTTLNAFCLKHDIDPSNATKAIIGTWTGKKANAIRSQIIQASKAKTEHSMPA